MPTFTGEGALYEDKRHLGDGTYEVDITPPQLQGGITRVSGRITGLDLDDDLINTPNTKLTLHMEEGIFWDCRLASPDGRLLPVGARLYRVVNGERVEL